MNDRNASNGADEQESGDESAREPDGSTRGPDGPGRMRAAGAGVGLGGVLLGAAALVMPFHLAAGVVAAVAVGIFLARKQLPIGYAIGVGAVGGIGIVESVPGLGLGLDAFTLAALAVVFGLLDAVGGTLSGRRRP